MTVNWGKIIRERYIFKYLLSSFLIWFIQSQTYIIYVLVIIIKIILMIYYLIIHDRM